MANTEVHTSNVRALFPRAITRSRAEALRELRSPCGGFRSPLTLAERARLIFTDELSAHDPLESATSIIAPGLPLNWHSMFRYLHREGILKSERPIISRRRNDLPQTFGVELKGTLERTHTDGELVDARGYGSSIDPETALSKALGEMLERRYLTIYKNEWLRTASYAELVRRKERAIDPTHLNGFLPFQIERNSRLKRSPDAPIRWIRGETIDGEKTWLPAQLIFWGYDSRAEPREPTLAQSTTNGAGAFFSRNDAILSGVLELIERDGFLIHWLNTLSPSIIDIADAHDPELHSLCERLLRYGVEPIFLDTTTDVGIPSTTAVLLDDRNGAGSITLGGSAGFDERETLLNALYEALNISHARDRREPFELPEGYVPFSDRKVGQKQRVALWQGGTVRTRGNFLFGGKRTTVNAFLSRTPQRRTTAEKLAHVRARLADLGEGYELYFYEAQHPVLKKLGYHVVQTIVPQLFPIYLHEHLPTLDSKRLREVPAKLGHKAADKYNPLPHPFA